MAPLTIHRDHAVWMKCASLPGQARWSQKQTHLDSLCRAAVLALVCHRGSRRPVTISPCCWHPLTLAYISTSTANNTERLGVPLTQRRWQVDLVCPQCSQWMTGPFGRINLRQAQQFGAPPASLDAFGVFLPSVFLWWQNQSLEQLILLPISWEI